MMTKCSCNNCSGHLEFEESAAGSTLACPHCGMDTVLFIPPVERAKEKPSSTPPPSQPIPSPVTLPQESYAKATGVSLGEAAGELGLLGPGGFLKGMSILMFIIGTVLVVNGCRGEFAEQQKADGSAIRQTVSAVQYGSGFIIMTLSLILGGVARLIRKN
jgi:DNA-directed RNA polymerase subunit RPC12/RpoP